MKNLFALCLMANVSIASAERVLTTSPGGHLIHHRQAFSPDGRYVYFDLRNDETRLAESTGIGRVELATGREEILYRTPTTSEFGPGCGAVTCNPRTGALAFIHGLSNASTEQPYAASRRFGGTLVEGALVHLDARDLTDPFTPGSLHGGTHAFHWSPDGKRISFTYNDAMIDARPAPDDLRTVGVMQTGKPVRLADPDTPTEFSGTCFAVLAVPVTPHPKPGSDQILRAFDEGWVDATRFAFQGIVRTAEGENITEVFLATLPDDLENEITIKRLTHSTERRFPGIDGPRHWLNASPDGALVAFLARDDDGIVQLHTVSAGGGEIRLLTHFAESIDTPFNWSPDGRFLACSTGERIELVDATTGKARALTSLSPAGQHPRYGVVFSPDGKLLAYNRLLPHADGGEWLQICLVSVPGGTVE
jgi:hypothetical protein